MNKKLIIAIGILGILFIGMAAVSFGQGNYGYCHRGGYRAYISMNDELRDAGFDEMVDAMEDRDYDGMRRWMNTVSDEDFEKMMEIMDKYESEIFPRNQRGIRQ